MNSSGNFQNLGEKVCGGSKANIAPQRRNAILNLPHSIATIIALMIAPQSQ